MWLYPLLAWGLRTWLARSMFMNASRACTSLCLVKGGTMKRFLTALFAVALLGFPA
jgi:hypothetical protein